MVNLNHGILNKLPIMLPPLLEQNRIISMVDQLSSVCGELQERLLSNQQTQLTLAEALVVQGLEG